MRAAEAPPTHDIAPFDLDALFDGLAGCSGVAIAVSGGSDSLALLRLLNIWPESMIRVGLTVDHALRPESALEAQRVADWCAALGIEHHILHWNGPKPATGIQAKARQARYDLMSAFCAAHCIPVLVTAHTQDDQAETVAMRARRTDSPAALAGIWPETEWNGVRVLRPLLGIRRPALQRWLRQIGQPWIDDPSNTDMRFERVQVRAALHPPDIDALAAQAEIARDTARALARAADAWVAEHVTRMAEGHFTLSLAALMNAPAALQDAVLARLAKRLGGHGKLDKLELDRLRRGLEAGKKMTLGGAVFVPRRGVLWVAREAGRIAAQWSAIGEDGVLLWDRRCRISAPPGSHVGPMILAPELPRTRDVPFFVHQSLPAVCLPDGTRIPALAGRDSGVGAKWL